MSSQSPKKVLRSNSMRNSILPGQDSISSIRMKKLSGKPLEADEKQALLNYDHYRLQILDSASSDEEFYERFTKLNAQANLGSYKEFLKDQYRFA